MITPAVFLEWRDGEACLSPRTPVLVRCSACLASFGEALGRARACPRCGSWRRDPDDLSTRCVLAAGARRAGAVVRPAVHPRLPGGDERWRFLDSLELDDEEVA